MAFVLTSFLYINIVPAAQADTIGTKVSGIVRDATSGPLEGITVKVSCNGQTKYWVTNESGYYEVKFLKLVCRQEYLVSAEASYNGQTLYMNTPVNEDFDAPTDFVFGAASVPEFGMTTGIVATLGAAMAWYYVQHRRQVA